MRICFEYTGSGRRKPTFWYKTTVEIVGNKTYAYKKIRADHYYSKANSNQESRYCDIKSHVCDPVGIGLIQTSTNISDRKSCHNLCDTDSKCKFTTFTFFRKEPRCFILSNCDRHVICPKTWWSKAINLVISSWI